MTQATKWTIDLAHSEVAFKVKHLMISHVKGVFKQFDADISSVSDDITDAEIDIWIDPSSIQTGDAKRDEHMKSAEFFDVINHKQITFSNSSIEKSIKSGELELWGDLTIKGVTKKIKLNLEMGGKMKDPWGNEKEGFSLTGKIHRSDWGLNWNNALEAGGLMVGNEVTISCEIQLIKKPHEDMTLQPDIAVKEIIK